MVSKPAWPRHRPRPHLYPSTVLFCLGEGSRTLGQALGLSFPSDQATQAWGSCLAPGAKRQESRGVTQHPPARPPSSAASVCLGASGPWWKLPAGAGWGPRREER